MLELYVLITIIIVFAILIYYYNDEEPFANEETPSFYLQGCPTGYTSFHHSDGTTMCCDGTVTANLCNSDKQCMLTGSSATIPNCTTLLMEEYKKKGEQCPTSMPSYYENTDTKTKGCTMGSLNKTMNGPSTTTQPVCMIYSSLDDNINASNSCANQKEMDEFPCFGTKCIKTLTQAKRGAPILITITFDDENGITHTAHTRQSMKRFLDASQPNWKDKGMDLSKNISVAEVAKAYYIDKTMQQKDIQI
jgi:hypothetical protein